ncbi:MAG: hypothetical protein JXA67_22200 [Micromonosporaceae bacterium]|nr:hypothetical protein [Micromonosporaceae bacterium]
MTGRHVHTDTAPRARYAGRRTSVARRPTTAGPRAPGRTIAAPTPHLWPAYPGTATVAAARVREEPVTDTADQASPPTDPTVPTRIIDGQPHTTRAAIAHMAGWKAGNSANVRAKSDPDFPHGVKVGREFWYPLAGPHGVDAYLALLAQRAQDKKPPEVKPGDPDDLLHGEDAADALHIAEPTLRSYVRYSLPYWTGERQGRPLLPPPDFEEQRENKLGAYTHRAWYRHTLTAHQKQRPGPGAGAGRPLKETG